MAGLETPAGSGLWHRFVLQNHRFPIQSRTTPLPAPGPSPDLPTWRIICKCMRRRRAPCFAVSTSSDLQHGSKSCCSFKEPPQGACNKKQAGTRMPASELLAGPRCRSAARDTFAATPGSICRLCSQPRVATAAAHVTRMSSSSSSSARISAGSSSSHALCRACRSAYLRAGPGAKGQNEAQHVCTRSLAALRCADGVE